MTVKAVETIYYATQSACRGRVRLALVIVTGAVLLVVLAFARGALAGRESSPAQTQLRLSVVRTTLNRAGLAAALDSLEAAAGADSAILRDAHQLAHDLGRRALARTGNNPSVISQCRPVFSSGCYHGVVEAFVRARGDLDVPELELMCTAAGESERPGPVNECVHGLGHGILGALSGDLRAALQHCDALSTRDRRSGCHSGAFMEAVNTASRGSEPSGGEHAHHHEAHAEAGDDAGRLVIDPTDPFSPCGPVDDPYAAACWPYQGHLILRHQGFDIRAALDVCRSAPPGRLTRCAHSIGFQITGLFQRDDRWILDQCSHRDVEIAAECSGGAAAALSSIDWSGGRVVRFCAAAPVDSKRACYRNAGRVLGTLVSPTELSRFCDRIEPDYAELCRSQLPSVRRSESRAAKPGSGRSGRTNAISKREHWPLDQVV